MTLWRPHPATSRSSLNSATLLRESFRPEVARSWLTGRNAHLGGARPIDVLRLGEGGDVLDALRSELAGGFA